VPRTPTTPTLLLCDALVAALVADWQPAAPDGAERAYFKRIADADGGDLKLDGRRVVVYPTDYGNDPASRGEDEFTHTVTVQVFERYPDAGDPPTEWIDERVDFVYEKIVNGFDYSHNGPPTWNGKLLTRSADVTVCQVGKLLGAGSLFVSDVSLVFSEIVDA
jgi:hypothetical protein